MKAAPPGPIDAGPIDAGRPVRTCVGCGARRPQGQLLRIAAREGTAPALDGGGRSTGRGAYLCPQAACLERAWKRRSLQRALKLKEGVPAQVRAQVLQVLARDAAADA